MHVEGETYTFTEDDTGLSTRCVIPHGNARMKANLDAKLYKGMLAERRHAKLKAVTAAAKRANMASRPKDVKELELRRQTPDEKPVFGWGSLEVAVTTCRMSVRRREAASSVSGSRHRRQTA